MSGPAERAFRAAYRAGAGAAAFALVPWAVLSGRAGELAERLGREAPPPRPGGRLVLHAVSAGEMSAAGALVAELAARGGGGSIVLTTGTAAGRAVAERLAAAFPVVEGVAYLPWDRPAAMARWLRRVAPRAVAVVETELWPGLFLACRDLRIPLAVASGRLYEKDRPRYRLVRPLFRRVLDAAAWIGTQDEEEREAFVAIGAPPGRTVVAGNLKWDVPPADASPGPAFEPFLSRPGPLVVAVSTHPPEERWLLRAAGRLRSAHPELRVVVAPRDVARAPAVAREAARAGWRAALLPGAGEGRGAPDASAVVVDAYGLVPALSARAEVVFVGGSLVAGGGHSPLEAAARGVPAVTGPYTRNVRSLVEPLAAAGGLVRLAGADPERELAEALSLLLADPLLRRGRGEAARSVVAAHRGAAARHADALLEIASGLS